VLRRQACHLKPFPVVGEPVGQFAFAHLREVRQQLREIQLRVYIVPAASAGQAGQDSPCSAATRISNEEAVFSIENDALHLSFRDVVVDSHRTSEQNTFSSVHWPRA